MKDEEGKEEKKQWKSLCIDKQVKQKFRSGVKVISQKISWKHVKVIL